MHDIYFVDALNAALARKSDDIQGIIDSGLGQFEEDLGIFLRRERHLSHIQSFSSKAMLACAQMQDDINTEREDHKDWETVAAERKIEIIEAKNKIDKEIQGLPLMLEKYRPGIKEDLRKSLQKSFDKLSKKLPAKLEEKRLPSFQRVENASGGIEKTKAIASLVAKVGQRQPIADEVEMVCRSVLEKHLKDLVGI